MRYPVMSSSDAASHLASKRAGNRSDADRLVKYRGEGSELSLGFLETLRQELASIKAMFPEGLKNHEDDNRFEAVAAKAIHAAVPNNPEVVGDPDFWIWLTVVHFSHVVEWRYKRRKGGTTVANYGVGAKNENLLFRLWLRAEMVLDEQAADSYHLCGAGQIDFYRSHLIRQSYANARNFSRALLRFQYPNEDDRPNLGVDHIRELVKRLRRLRTNLFLEILDEDECRKVIEDEAEVLAASN